MSRHSYSSDWKVQPPGYLDINHRECDRDTDPAVQNIIEKTVPRIVVILRVSMETEGFKKNLVDLLNSVDRAIRRVDFCLGCRRNVIEQIEVGTQLELWVFLTRHDE